MSSHLILLAPDLFPAYHQFVRAAKESGASVSGIGRTGKIQLAPSLRRYLDDWESVSSPTDVGALVAAARRLVARRAADRVETVEETLVDAAARVREALSLPGLSVTAAELCRDKPRMKAALRAAGLPCAESAAATTLADLLGFAERVGYPLIVKPRAGMGSLNTVRIDRREDLERAARRLGLSAERPLAIEEYVEGHEGIWDTLSIAGAVRHEFIAHYFPNVLPALEDRRVSPQIVATNRVDLPSYGELRETGRRVVAALGIETGATHMEWFFGAKGLKISELAARPPGDRIWDLHSAGNDVDLYREWATAILHARTEASLSRRSATGIINLRPDRDGRVARIVGVEQVRRLCGDAWLDAALPEPGASTTRIEKGYLVNAWVMLRHPDYDELRRLLDLVGRTVRIEAGAA